MKIEKGSDALYEKLEKYNVDDIIVIKRRNVTKKKFGIF